VSVTHHGPGPETGEPDETASSAPPADPSADQADADRWALRILILEDELADAELVQRLLTRAGFDLNAVVVDTKASFAENLDISCPDVILADYALPGFSGESALKLAREQCPGVPFIVISGELGDEGAVELLRQGATDYVLKDRPARLPSVIRRALAEVEERARIAQVEAQLYRSQHLAIIGRLAGGVAHEFNNQVGAMLHYAAFIREEAAERAGRGTSDDGWEGVRRDAEQIEQAGQRVIGLVRQLLAAGSQETVRSEPVDLNKIVCGFEQPLRDSLGGHSRLRLSLAPQLWPVTADPALVRQVLLNLATNASEAMPGGGSVSIETRNVTIGDAEVRHHAELGSGPYVCLIFADSGTGMEPEILEHAFEPFFTTKPLAEGCGLGLASVYGIIRQAGGTVDISSAPGTGTTVTAWLPAVLDAATA